MLFKTDNYIFTSGVHFRCGGVCPSALSHPHSCLPRLCPPPTVLDTWYSAVQRLVTGQSDKVAYADDLPDEAEDQVRLSGLQVLRPDVDNVAADRLRRVDSQREVLVYLIDVQFAAVQRPLVDCTRLRTVHHLTVMTHLHGDRLVASITFVKKSFHAIDCTRYNDDHSRNNHHQTQVAAQNACTFF